MSFWWGRVVTINIGPGARPARRVRTHLIVVLQRLVRATGPKVRRGHAPRHSMRADSRALDPSPAHPTVLLPLRTHGRPSPHVVENAPEATSTAPAGTDREAQVRPQPLGTSIRQAVTTDGDIARGRVRVVPGGGIRRRRGQQSRPRTRHLPPATRKCPRTRRMPPAAREPGREGRRLRCRARTARRRSRAAPPGPWARSRPRRRPASPPARRATC